MRRPSQGPMFMLSNIFSLFDNFSPETAVNKGEGTTEKDQEDQKKTRKTIEEQLHVND